jgi:hypothetical protein
MVFTLVLMITGLIGMWLYALIAGSTPFAAETGTLRTGTVGRTGETRATLRILFIVFVCAFCFGTVEVLFFF